MNKPICAMSHQTGKSIPPVDFEHAHCYRLCAVAETDPSSAPEWLRVGVAAKVTRISARTLRYYERAGLLHTPRTAIGQRRYGPQELLALAFIRRLREIGMPIRVIRSYADAVRAGSGRERGLPLLLAHREQVFHDLARRQAHLDAIDRKITAYRDGARTSRETP